MLYDIINNVQITDLAAEGKSIAKINGIVYFVANAVPGDIVDLQITKKKKNYFEAKAINFIKYSDIKETPACEHFGSCGGCKWQNLKYEEQLKYKQKQVVDNFERIAKVELPEISPILKSEKTFFYRNKLEYTFSNRKFIVDFDKNAAETDMNGLGFHVKNFFDKVLDINKCYLQRDPSNAIRLFVREFAIKNNFEFYNVRQRIGFLRNIVIRTSNTGEVMIIMIFNYNDKENIEKLLNAISDNFSDVSSLSYIINSKMNDTYADLDIIHFKGERYITETMEDLTFRVGPKSFYQTNSEQAYNLYKIVREYADLKGTEIVYDLYTGTGTIANFVASKTKKIVGIEYVDLAIEDAKVNSEINNIKNTAFFSGDVQKILNDEFIETHGKPDVIITDPPRAGMHVDVVEQILKILPKKIVYVSCDPATQARDLAIFSRSYKISRIQPVDMFPHTHHIENVVLLELN